MNFMLLYSWFPGFLIKKLKNSLMLPNLCNTVLSVLLANLLDYDATPTAYILTLTNAVTFFKVFLFKLHIQVTCS